MQKNDGLKYNHVAMILLGMVLIGQGGGGVEGVHLKTEE